MPRRHILFLLTAMNGGGAQRAVLELLRHLDPCRYQTSLALFELGGEYMDAVPDRVSLIDLSAYVGVRNMLRRVWAIRRLVVEIKPDVIIASLEGPNCDLMRAAALIRHRTRLVITEQNNLTLRLRHSRTGVMHKVKASEIRLLYRFAHRIVAVSQGIKADLSDNFGQSSERVTVIQNPVDVEGVQNATRSAASTHILKESRKSIVAVGRMVPQKGFDDLIQAFSLVRRRIRCSLTILGQGPLRTDLEGQITELGLGEDVRMPGFVENPWAFIRDADIYVSSSRWEGFPLALLEALAVGTPAIVTDCDYGPREIIEHGRSGILVPVGNVEEMGARMTEMLSDDAMRARFAREGKRRVMHFDSRVIARRYGQLIENLMAE
jgi:glycosyltransferase involved in cell wall biosynthesis